ncbi:MAG: 5-bromo-4-chloroindolyl phosphate hydrolysis family protein, partial [Peptostreptococcus sp.]|nr:5-bromo-4-chloroindolyl phosphate hydrolysis family protein [Peptostreptococcus sp.]
VGIAESSVVKDLHRLIDKRFFYQGHLVENDTIFLVNDELYSYYQSGQESRRQRDIEKEKLESNKELKEFQDTCQEVKQELVSLEGSLIDPDMKQRCSDIFYLIESLETIVAKNPDKLHRLDRFSSYYMPITIKLLKSYQDLENKPSTDLLNKSMVEIGTTMDTIIEAYQRLVDQLTQVDNIDIKSDISVLKTMLAQDGLSGTSPFENKTE